MTESKKKIDLPFKVVKSEVSGGFIDAVHTAFTGGIDIVSYHEDKYGNLDEAVLQSPFTQQWVGGKSHRHIALNTGSDNSGNRPEAFHLEFNSNGVRFFSHAYRNSPPAYWSRDGLAKRPLNIENIRDKDLYVGNHSKGYQVLQTSGRRITNNLIVDGFEASGSLTTQFIFGESNYTLPELTTTGETVIVERFNAPGSKEESSRGALDREGEEMSPNIPLPFRNIKIRQPFYEQLSQRTPQGGGSIHGVNRNRVVRAGNELVDNGFVMRSLPGTDIQYSWITASAYTTAAELGGYQSFAGDYNRNEAYTDIQFVTASLIDFIIPYRQDGPQLTSSDGTADTDRLGTSVSINIDGTVIAAGASSTDIPEPGDGSIVVFKKTSLGWYQDGPPLTSSDGTGGGFDSLGSSVSINSAGTVIAAGAFGADTSGTDAGSIVVFKSSSLGWYQDGLQLTSSDGAGDSSDNLGSSVSINSDGTVIAAGARRTDVPGDAAGSVVVFKSSSLGWHQDGLQLTSSDGAGNSLDFLGYSVSINSDGTVIAAGAERTDIPGADAGSVVVFKSSSLGWYQDGLQLTSSDGAGNSFDLLGSSVSINSNGTVVAAGSPSSDVPGSGAGSVIVFKSSSLGWYQDGPQLTSAFGNNLDSLGSSVSINSDGTVIAAGADGTDNPGSGAGSVVVFRSSSFGWYEVGPQLTSSDGNTDNSDRLGYSISVSGDGTVIAAGAYGTDNPGTNAGSVVVFFETRDIGTEIDNNFIQSLLKDKKTVDITTNTFSIESSLFASFSEYTNSPYTFTTWRSIRNGETPVARALRKNNILSVQDEPKEIVTVRDRIRQVKKERRGQTSTNYTEPAVSFKYRPLKHTFLFVGNDRLDLAHEISHTYANNVSTFANKDLLIRLKSVEDKQEFYDLIYNYYTKPEQQVDNPIEKLLRLRYQENIWPREENTGIDETRKRARYFLDRAGFTRDGYDRQLGTQRAFWRDLQADRKRSPNSEGGHYNSFNYLSTLESGSSFSVNGSTTLLDESTYLYSSSFTQLATIDDGLFNSIALMEYTPSETLVYSSSFLVYSASTDLLISPNEQINVSYKRGYRFDTAGELNHAFVDFYGVSKISGSDILRDIGAIYRNSYYKSMLTTKQYEFGSSLDLIDTTALINTEDDENKIRPKLRYTTFVGGGELNNSSYVQTNFRENIEEYNLVFDFDSSSIMYSTASAISDIILGNKVAFCRSADLLIKGYPEDENTAPSSSGSVEIYKVNQGNFDLLQTIQSPSTNTISEEYYFGSEISINASGERIFISEILGTGSVHVYQSSSLSGWTLVDTITASSPPVSYELFGTRTATNNVGDKLAIAEPAANDSGSVYIFESSSIGWSQTQILTYSAGDDLGGGGARFGFSLCFDFSGSLLAVGAPELNSSGSVYIFESSSIGWNQQSRLTSSLGNTFFGSSCTFDSSSQKIIIGAPYDTNVSTFNGACYIFKSGSSNWELEQRVYDLNPSGGPQIVGFDAPSFRLDNNTFAVSGYSKTFIYQSGSSGWSKIQTIPLVASTVFLGRQQFFDQNDNLIINNLLVTASVVLDNFFDNNARFETYYYDARIVEGYVPSTLFSQTFTTDDIIFSTLDNGLQRTTERDSGRKPFFDSYDDYVEDIRGITKDHSVIPEFRISEHMEYYVQERAGVFNSDNKSFLTIDGTEVYQSANSASSFLYNPVFWRTYATSDLLKKHDEIREENKDVAEIDTVTIRVDGVKKLLPYNGFYPQDRITQIANLYSDYIDNNLAGGVYNVSYENTDLTEELIVQHPEGDSSIGSTDAISTAEFGGKHYIAIGYPFHNSRTGLVKIFSSSAGGYLDQNNWDQTSVVQYIGNNTNDQFGKSVKLVSASNGLNLFVSEYGASFAGAVYQMTSSNGTDWSAKVQMSSSATEDITGSAGSSFGNQIDALYDDNNGKFILAIGAYRDSTLDSNAGQIYVVTSSDGQSWSQKNETLPVALPNVYYGTSLSIYSGSLSYYLAASIPADSSTVGAVGLLTSSDGLTYSPGAPTSILASQPGSGIGIGGIKALEYSGKSYIFYSEPYRDSNSLTDNGAAFVAYQEGGSWISVKIVEGESNYDWITSIDDDIDRVSAVSSSSGLYYAFGAASVNTENGANSGKVFFGRSTDGLSFQTDEELVVITGQTTLSVLGSSATMFLSGTTPISVFTDNQTIYGLTVGENISLNVIVSGSEAELAWKQTAIEPLFGPGIMYNTIKSGIAVDWPCATGSSAFITSSGGVIINPFYPKAEIMSSYQGDNGFYNLQGSLKSKIDYRIPFENMIYPKEMFEEKDEITNDLRETYAIGSTIPTGSAISQLLNGVYVYGGYETYVNPSDVGDIFGQTAKRFSVPFVYKKANGNDNGLYTRAISNFLAESVKFFLKDEKMVTFTSKPDSQWEDFKKGKTYYMDVVLEKSANLVMMEAYWDDKHPIGPNGEKMNGRYFGYPVNKTTKEIWGGEEFTETERRLMFNDPAYAPYTPPYFEGRAIARLSFTPDTDGSYSLSEVLGKLQIEDVFTFASKGWQAGSDAELNKMSIGASIDLFGSFIAPLTDINTVPTGEVTLSRTSRQDAISKVWVISPKLETPVLDFSEQQIVPYSNDYLKTSGFGRGMWSGYGAVPSGDKKLSLSLSSPFSREIGDSYGGRFRNTQKLSLLKHVGFEEKEQQIGVIADEKEISEAVILIPYLEINKPIRGITVNNRFLQKNLIRVRRDILSLQKRNIESGQPAVKVGDFGAEKDITETSISRMITKLKDYVLPPGINFLDNSRISPFVAYVFEFKHTLTQQDLSNIWQGLMPDISYNAQLASIENGDDNVVQHKSSLFDFFHSRKMPDNLRWMVFKIKKRAEIDYSSITRSTKDDLRFVTELNIGQQESPYSYNWPYDYFSLIEMAKIEITLDYKNKET